MTKRDFVSVLDLTKKEILEIFKLTKKLKTELKQDIFTYPLKDKTLAMIFEKSSTRTRVSFEVGIKQLGGTSLFLSSRDIQLGRGESIQDTAKVLSRYVDIIMARTYSHKTITELAKYSTVPVINALSDLLHPCQVMADYYTIWEKLGTTNIKFVYTGDGNNNMANSLMLISAILGAEFVCLSPKAYRPNPILLEQANKIANKSGAKITITDKLAEASGADVIYTDVWTSMGQEEERKEREKIMRPFQVNSKLTAIAKPNYLFMHCLPAHREEEVTAEVIDGPNSIVFDQAENRLHVQKAIMLGLMKKNVG